MNAPAGTWKFSSNVTELRAAPHSASTAWIASRSATHAHSGAFAMRGRITLAAPSRVSTATAATRPRPASRSSRAAVKRRERVARLGVAGLALECALVGGTRALQVAEPDPRPRLDDVLPCVVLGDPALERHLAQRLTRLAILQREHAEAEVRAFAEGIDLERSPEQRARIVEPRLRGCEVRLDQQRLRVLARTRDHPLELGIDPRAPQRIVRGGFAHRDQAIRTARQL